MQIDWITVAAQIVNFLVLVWLLQRFLYGPVVRAMDRREQRIADRLREAQEEKEAAETEARKYREKQEELESRQSRLIAEARDRAEEERKSLQESARADIARRKQEWLAQLRNQQRRFLQDIRRQTTERFYALSRRALSELANADLESEIANVFVEQLEELDKDTRRKIAAACKEAEGAVVVTSRFDLSAADKRRITMAIHDKVFGDADVGYRQSDECICGIELKVGSQTVAWSLNGYFDSLQRELAEQITSMSDETERQAAQ